MRAFEYTRVTLFQLLEWIGTWGGLIAGLAFGLKLFGIPGAVLGTVLGLILGHGLGQIPGSMVDRYFLKEIERSPDSKLREMISQGQWKFFHTMALLQLAARGQDVMPEFPRVLAMLASDDVLTRRYGFDALRLVYTAMFDKVPDYNPMEPTETCRRKIAALCDEQRRRNDQPGR